MKRIIINKKELLNWNFEAFSQNCYYVSKNKEPVITVYKTGSFILNAPFIQQVKNELIDNQYVKFFYDKSTHSIGVKFINDRNEPGVSKISSQKLSNRMFSAKMFFNYYALDLGAIVGRYRPRRILINEKIGHLWIISLKDRIKEK